MNLTLDKAGLVSLLAATGALGERTGVQRIEEPVTIMAEFSGSPGFAG